MRRTTALAAFSALLIGCTGTTASTIPPTEIPALSADQKGVRSVWTTEGKVVDVAEPYAVEVRTNGRTADGHPLPDEIVFDGPVIAARTGSIIVVQECARAVGSADTRCIPSTPEVGLPLASIESVSVHTVEQPRDGRSGPNARTAWIAAAVFGGLLGAAGIAAVVTTSQGLWGGAR